MITPTFKEHALLAQQVCSAAVALADAERWAIEFYGEHSSPANRLNTMRRRLMDLRHILNNDYNKVIPEIHEELYYDIYLAHWLVPVRLNSFLKQGTRFEEQRLRQEGMLIPVGTEQGEGGSKV